MAVAAPVLLDEMVAWVAIGGHSKGIVGDANHNRGFHRGANEVPSSDYSRRRDPNGSDGPFVNWSYACAGDFGHNRDPFLLQETRRVLNGLMNGKYPMVCEFIGQPWYDRPVYYWARWNGIKTLQRYTGSGHGTWNHIAGYRSMIDKPWNLWTPGGMLLPCKEGDTGIKVKYWQEYLTVLDDLPEDGVDGIFGTQTKGAVNKFRARYNLKPLNYISYWTACRIQIDAAVKVAGSKLTVSPGLTTKEITEIVRSVIAANVEELRGPPGRTPTTLTIESVGKVTGWE